jgi:hypothetical protein
MRVVNSMIIEKVVGLDLLAQILQVGPLSATRPKGDGYGANRLNV